MAPSSASSSVAEDPSAFGLSSLRPQLDLRPLDSVKNNSDNEQDLAVADLLAAAVDGDLPGAKKFANKLIHAGIGVDEAVAAVDDPAGRKRCGPLHLAAAAGKADMCALLIEEFDANVDATDVEGATPLMFAVQGAASTTVVGLLLSHGANANKADNCGIVPLHIAAEKGSYEVAELLLSKGAEVDPVCEKVGAPVHIAAENGNARLLKLLLQHNADCDRFSSSFNTALAASIFGSSLECMEILIEAGADINAGSPETPLMTAARKGLVECTKHLLNAGADANIPDENGKVPVEIAALKSWEECVKILFPVTTPLAEYADWSIDGIIRHGKIVRVRLIKAEGDAAFKKKDYLFASCRYTQALDMDPADSTLYAKRSLCFQEMNDNEKALADAKTFRDMQLDLPEESSEEEGTAMKLVEEHCGGIEIEALMSDLNIGSGSDPAGEANSVRRAAAPGRARRAKEACGHEAAAGPPPRRSKSNRRRKPSVRISGPEWTK